MLPRRSTAVAAAGLWVVAATGCGGAKAGTIQVTNDTASAVTVMECPPGQPVGCGDVVGRQRLDSGASASYAPARCATQHCEPTEIVEIGTDGSVRCTPAPPPDGKHSFLLLVTTFPTSDCSQWESSRVTLQPGSTG